jgi:hypothetical protein
MSPRDAPAQSYKATGHLGGLQGLSLLIYTRAQPFEPKRPHFFIDNKSLATAAANAKGMQVVRVVTEVTEAQAPPASSRLIDRMIRSNAFITNHFAKNRSFGGFVTGQTVSVPRV